MQNKTKEFLNRNLIEGEWYLVSHPLLPKLYEPMRYEIVRNGDIVDYGTLSNGEHILNDVYHKDDIKVFTIEVPSEINETRQRQQNNFKILKKLEEYFKKYPEYRFIQGLYALNIIETKNGELVDKFFEESKNTLEKLINLQD